MPEFIAGLATPVSTTAPEGKIGAHPPFALQDPKGAVILDNFTPHDAPLVAAACQDPEIQLYNTVPAPYGPEEARSFVEKISPPDLGPRRGLLGDSRSTRRGTALRRGSSAARQSAAGSRDRLLDRSRLARPRHYVRRGTTGAASGF